MWRKINNMSPKFLTQDGYVFKIFSLEEDRMHIHVVNAEKTAKFWLEPEIGLAKNNGFSSKELSTIQKIIVSNADDFKSRYKAHIGRRIDD